MGRSNGAISEIEWEQLQHSLRDNPATLDAHQPTPLPQRRFQNEMQAVNPAESLPVETIRTIQQHFRSAKFALQRIT